MKAIYEEVKQIKGYEATDGRFFKDEPACREYEESAKFVISNMYAKLVVGSSSPYSIFEIGNDDCSLECVHIGSVDDLKILNMYLNSIAYGDCSIVDSKYIGSNVFIEYGYDCDWYTIHGTKDEILSRIGERLSKMEVKNVKD